MIVVDTNVIAYLWLPGKRTVAAERLLKEDSDWNAPLLWRSEFRNVLAGCLRRGDVQLETALQIANGAEEQMRDREFSIPSAQVLARVEESDVPHTTASSWSLPRSSASLSSPRTRSF